MIPQPASPDVPNSRTPQLKRWLSIGLMPLLQMALVLWMYGGSGVGSDWILQSGFLAITTLAGWQLCSSRRNYSLNQVFWVFVLVYFGVAPAVQTAVGFLPWSAEKANTAIPRPYQLRALLCVLLCLGCYLLTYSVLNSRFSQASVKKTNEPRKVRVHRFVLLASSVLLISAVMGTVFIGIENLFVRSRLELAIAGYPQSAALLFNYVLRGAMLFVSLMGIRLYRRGQLSLWALGLILASIVALNFPLALPRFLAGTFYLSWLVAWGWRPVVRRHGYALLLLTALLVLAPLSNISRKIYFQEGSPGVGAYVRHAFTNEYDGFATLARTMMYVDAHGATWGKQAAGALLFFVPRSVWPAKAEGSGALVYGSLGFSWKNIAAPFFSEGFINFGWGGAVLFALLLGWGVTAYDNAFWRHPNGWNSLLFLAMYYPVALSLLLFLLRGDLMSGIAYSAGLFGAGAVLHKVVMRQ